VRPDVLAEAAELAKRGEVFALVTVVRRETPSSAHVGDSAVVTRDGGFHGWVGGGCTHPAVVREALAALADRAPRLIALSPTPDADHRPGVVPVLLTCHSGGSVDIYIEPILPLPRLVVYGVSPVAQSLARLAKVSAYHVTVVDPAANRANFPEADAVHSRIGEESSSGDSGAWVCAVIATMGDGDEDAARAGLALDPAYLGVVASQKRFAQLRAALSARGVADADLVRMKNPAGLDIGAELSEEIALSILGEIVQTRRRNRADAGETRAPSPPAQAMQAGSARDPICGMSVLIAGASHRSEHAGRAYYFCGAECKRQFERDPARYTDTVAARESA
jgi:xanthine dehydrogenase accessory factor